MLYKKEQCVNIKHTDKCFAGILLALCNVVPCGAQSDASVVVQRGCLNLGSYVCVYLVSSPTRSLETENVSQYLNCILLNIWVLSFIGNQNNKCQPEQSFS